MTFIHYEQPRVSHPVDIVEQIASLNQWIFDRDEADEICISVQGMWTEFRVAFTWLPDVETMHISAAFEMKVPQHRHADVLKLISMINEQLWVGHFGLWESMGTVLFRHALILPGGIDPTSAQCEALFKSAILACERYYSCFQFAVWSGKGPKDALDCSLFETVGSA